MVILALTCAIGTETNTIATGPSNRIDVIVIPSLEIRDTPPAQVLEFLVTTAIRPIPEPPTNWSIGMINPPPVENPRPLILDTHHPAWTNMPRLTLEMRRVTLRQALDRVTQELGLTYEVTGSNIVLRTKDGEELSTKRRRRTRRLRLLATRGRLSLNANVRHEG